ncbi:MULTISPECIES: TonB-dependent receptor [unclassified Lysobacter]|uniref:TonB-dependent receptor plug domain-containing protein n=1 Tax=unclassified Lysobacter TaxID=2635362 RepID=UPI000AE319F7|nr:MULTISPECIES: TonB-dependent receptor [unclassified Lysobacter]
MATRNAYGLQRSRLTAALISALILSAAGTAGAQDTSTPPPPASKSDATDVQGVVVTGSRIKRAEIEGPAPVTVISAADIERQGFTTVYEALNTLTQFSGSVQNELNQSGFTPNASVLNLRGLGPEHVLTLINGHRVADYPRPYNSQSNVVNLNAIPAAAIERIEVLTSGASAIYGSDAISGVVNVILKSNYEGNEVQVRVGTTTRGGGDTGDVQWIGGRVGDNWSLTYAFEYLTREPIFASQREFMDSYRDDPSTDNPSPVIGLRIRNRSRVISGTSQYVLPGGLAVCDQFKDFERYPVNAALNPSVVVGNSCGYWSFPATQQIRNSRSDLSGYVRGTWDFANGMQMYGSLTAWSSEAKAASSTQFWQSPLFVDPVFNVANGLPAASILDMQRIITPSEIGGRDVQQTKFKENSYNFDIGLSGTALGDKFDWDVYYSRSEYTSKSDQPRLKAKAINDWFLGPRIGTTPGNRAIYNFNQARYLRPLTPEEFASLSTVAKAKAKSQADTVNLTFAGDLFELPAGPLGFATVLEAARQEYSLNPDRRTLPGADPNEAIYNLTDTIGGGKRSRYAAGVEFSVPIVDTLKAQLAGRYDKYDDRTDTGGAFTYNLGLEYRPVSNLLLRGSYGTTFRAPDMHYLYAGTSGFFTTYFDEFACRRDGFQVADCNNNATYNYSAAGVRSGNLELEEETGKSWTAGVVWDIIDNLSVSADYYSVELENIIGDDVERLLNDEASCRLGVDRSGATVNPGSAICVDALSRITRGAPIVGPGLGNIATLTTAPRNLQLLETNGIDARVRYRIDTDRLGDFRFELGWTHVLSQKRQDFAADPVEEYRDDRKNHDFRSRANFTTSWSKQDWSANIYGTRWGSLPDWEESGRRIAPYFLWNVNVSKKITNKATLGFFVNNVFDKLHPRDDSHFSYPYFWSAYSPIGREVFLQFDYKFQ